MSWSWSHTAEAQAHAGEEVYGLSRKTLEVIFAEWHAHTDGDSEAFDEAAYKKALAGAKDLPDDTLAEFIIEKMENQALCTNGGWMAWACPYGCGCHMVPFSPPKQEAA